ncbi:DUF4350 domain-containing protein [Nocardioides jishulii]|uniref:DUF4350 domain-containing protein n=1 Tax=Nocardioides jishulii TaxID=2575440 RepID=A0A4U2YWY2_9ACTN|nr:DUF4350 domain-containing protein [Nocardioides jishulii]QCX28426.1 DUF4350 domain-containing protein [Nocardioides jishulii]TKI64681.1 DUF4350 domain-containing protein [Nocardioides jishulii]
MKRRGTRAGWVIGAVVAASLLAAVLLRPDDARTSAPLDPHNPAPSGAQAVARVLADEGVEVVVARGRSSLEDVTVDARTTVLVTSTEELGASTVEHLRSHAGAGDLVLASPPPGVVDLFGEGLDALTQSHGPTDASCDDAVLGRHRLQVDEALVFPGPGCFPVDDGVLLAQVGERVRFLGAAQLLTNEQVTTSGNAAVALSLLGSTGRLVWYVPDSADLSPSELGGLDAALPPWIGPGLWILVLTGVALVLWRVRRLGPLAVEPLPIPVRAIESVVGRGRLQQRSGDRTHAAGVLRTAARRRIGEHLQVPADRVEDLCLVVSQRSGRPLPEVRALLTPDSPAPTSDTALVRLAQELTALTEEVRTR